LQRHSLRCAPCPGLSRKRLAQCIEEEIRATLARAGIVVAVEARAAGEPFRFCCRVGQGAEDLSARNRIGSFDAEGAVSGGALDFRSATDTHHLMLETVQRLTPALRGALQHVRAKRIEQRIGLRYLEPRAPAPHFIERDGGERAK
jgi:hypothetical protein